MPGKVSHFTYKQKVFAAFGFNDYTESYEKACNVVQYFCNCNGHLIDVINICASVLDDRLTIYATVFYRKKVSSPQPLPYPVQHTNHTNYKQ